jgi:hypothetical protein
MPLIPGISVRLGQVPAHDKAQIYQASTTSIVNRFKRTEVDHRSGPQYEPLQTRPSLPTLWQHHSSSLGSIQLPCPDPLNRNPYQRPELPSSPFMLSGICISKCNICNNNTAYDTLHRSVLSSEHTWHTVFCALYPKPLTATYYSSEYFFIMLMFHPLNHNHNTKEAVMCHSVTVFLHACFNPLKYSIR